MQTSGAPAVEADIADYCASWEKVLASSAATKAEDQQRHKTSNADRMHSLMKSQEAQNLTRRKHQLHVSHEIIEASPAESTHSTAYFNAFWCLPFNWHASLFHKQFKQQFIQTTGSTKAKTLQKAPLLHLHTIQQTQPHSKDAHTDLPTCPVDQLRVVCSYFILLCDRLFLHNSVATVPGANGDREKPIRE